MCPTTATTIFTPHTSTTYSRFRCLTILSVIHKPGFIWEGYLRLIKRYGNVLGFKDEHSLGIIYVFITSALVSSRMIGYHFSIDVSFLS